MPRRQASLETNLCRKGIWHVGPLQLALPLDATDTLGLLRVAGPPLTLFDLDTFAWLTERWREGRDHEGMIRFTLYSLGRDLYDRKPSGEERRLMRASLSRLQDATFELEGYDAAAASTGRLEAPSAGGRVKLLGSLLWSNRGSRERHVVFLDPFIRRQLEAGYLTYLDWRILRALDGLAKRLSSADACSAIQAGFTRRRSLAQAHAHGAVVVRSWYSPKRNRHALPSDLHVAGRSAGSFLSVRSCSITIGRPSHTWPKVYNE